MEANIASFPFCLINVFKNRHHYPNMLLTLLATTITLCSLGKDRAFLKIIRIDLKKHFAKVMPESLDDLWHLYNIILKRDEVHARTTRQTKPDDQYARPTKAKRVPVNLGVQVEKMYWDRVLNRLRVNGIVCAAPEKLSIKGSRHTIDVSINKPVTIVKKHWLKHELDRLRRASKITAAPLTIISMDDEEYCVAILRQYGIDVKSGWRAKLPGKFEAEKRVKAKQLFFKGALKSLREAWAPINSPIVVIGPGYIKDDFVDYLHKEAKDVASSIIGVKGVNSAGLSGIQESLRSGILSNMLEHMRVADEMKAMEELLARLGQGKSTITYGFDDVEKASTYGAVEKLLVADSTLRETTDEKRIALETLIKNVEEARGDIMVISTEHEAGTKLLSLGGVAALLRFPLP
ncbi:MAG: mRNA surveillance protein pelota [Candidatus Bathyarchaeum sp.]|nr:MAG: mRNA surveillance protein pelota [Candidatus Bathyarchaeum sp.]